MTHSEARKRIEARAAAVDDAGTLPPAIDWKDIAELATKQPQLVETFLPALTVRPLAQSVPELSDVVGFDDPWTVEGRVI
jgi:hypothetical protein